MPLVSFIPRRYEEGFKELAQLDDKIFSSIQDGLSSALLTSSTEKLAVKVGNLKDLDSDSIQGIFYSVGGLIPLLEDGTNVDEIVEDVASISQIGENAIEIKDIPKFKERLKILLTDGKIYYAAKARDLLTESGNVFLSCRIVTDIRPVFDLDLDKPPEAGFILHNLHIHYQADAAAPHLDIYLSLDSNDVQTLIEVLMRAENKEQSLQLLLKKAGMTNLNDE